MTQQEFQISDELYIYPTPAGAYYAVSSPHLDPARKLLRSLFQFRSSPRFNIDSLCDWTDIKDKQEIGDLLNRMQDLGWLQGCDTLQYVPNGALEDILPNLLAPLSSQGHALLADNLGFHIANKGFNYETAEQLSALSADITTLHERHMGLLSHNLGLNSSAWALVDVAGNSQVGFWPIYIGSQRFVLVVGGVPHLNQPVLITLIWALSIRYGKGDQL